MHEKEGELLQRLDDGERFGVVLYWHLLLARCILRHGFRGYVRHFRELPIPFKVQLIHFPIILVFIFGLPPASELPPVLVPLLLIGSFCVALVIGVLLPKPNRSRSLFTEIKTPQRQSDERR